jgi:hypothetical protein
MRDEFTSTIFLATAIVSLVLLSAGLLALFSISDERHAANA